MVCQKRIRIAFIHVSGLFAGGTEMFLQHIAANLPQDEFDVHYYYASGVPLVDKYGNKVEGGVGHTDPNRMRYMMDHGIRLIEFHARGKDTSTPHLDWVDTDFWEKFDEKNYDIIQIGTPGDSHYPFHLIKKTPIVDSIHYNSGINNQFNISRVLHVSHLNAQRWIKLGGDAKRLIVVSLFIVTPQKPVTDLRKSLGWKDKFIFGLLQRENDGIFSEVPLLAYKSIENDKTAFLMFGGSPLYQQQAKELGLKNVKFLPHSGDLEATFSFLSTLDVYAHGRKDGEIHSSSLAGVMSFNLPVVSHTSKSFNGHIDSLGDAGVVVNTVDEYTAEMFKLMHDRAYYELRSSAARRIFKEKYDFKEQIDNIVQIYRDVVRDPFPNKIRRVFLVKVRYYLIKIRRKLAKTLQEEYQLIKKRYPKLGELRARVRVALQSWKSSFLSHHLHYSQAGALERERKSCGQHEKSNHFDHPENKLGDLLKRYPHVRGTVVDIGSGAGWLSARLSKEFERVIAIEPSISAIRIAQELYPNSVFPNIEWKHGFAEEQLKSLHVNAPICFITSCVCSHLTDDAVKKICREINRIAPKGSIFGISENWGLEYHEFLWHVRTKSWWQDQFPDWEIDFHGPNIQGVAGRHKGFHGVRIQGPLK